jgi:glucose-1-phosphate adenylyltransferase
MMLRNKILAIILAGGEGSRMRTLTRDVPKPALPFGGSYSLIDFPLSNCVHSGIDDVWVVMQYLPAPLQRHLENGRPWDLDRHRGGLQILQPHTGTRTSGWHQGNADALFRHHEEIRRAAPDYVLVLSADHLYTLDFARILAAHQKHKADVTAVVTKVPENESATRFGNVGLTKAGRIENFSYKPETPQSNLVTTEIFLYSAAPLLDALTQLAARAKEQKGREKLEDFGHELFPQMVKAGKAYAFRHDGYWRDVGTPDAYHAAHMDLLLDAPPLDLHDENWPILTNSASHLPARVLASAQVGNSLLAPGSTIGGSVERCVIGTGAQIREGARLESCVVLTGAVIGKDAQIHNAIVLPHAHVEQGRHGNQKKVALIG